VPDLDCTDIASRPKRLRYDQHYRDDLEQGFVSEYHSRLIQ